ncbi:MAG: metallophosphoesterase, partial [Ilumatobacteraceae bacterium]
MPRTVIAQISDTHIPGRGEASHPGADPVGNLTVALAHASQRCAGVVITGDCAAKAGTDTEYSAFAEVIATATVPVWLAPGNHDDSAKMQRLFNLPSVNGRCDYVVDLPGGRLVVLDSSRLGREDGSLDESQTAWLDEQLAGRRSLVVMHHPCIRVGGSAFDSIRLDEDSVRRLASVV